MQPNPPKPLVLVVLDGWGVREDTPDNAITQAKTPFYDSLLQQYPWTTLESSGVAVGLPAGKAGNSETGHMNIGAGYIVEQDVIRITNSIEKGDFFTNKQLLQTAHHIKNNQARLHVMGLLSDANVHSEFTHLLALIDFAEQEQLPLYIHVFTDGRDSSPTDGVYFMQKLQDYVRTHTGHIASIVGRYYAMDRDRRWNRTQVAYDLLTQGNGRVVNNPTEAIRNAYQQGETDEFLKPMVLPDNGRVPIVKDGDAIIFFNFRTDRPRQLSHAFVDDTFDHFTRKKRPRNVWYTTMTEYELGLPVDSVLFDPILVDEPFGKVIAEAGLRQLHISETEKIAHVTYFFNGGREEPFAREDRIHVPSPQVATYDLAPEMKAREITDAALKAIADETYEFILINYANPDMVAHTGDFAATVMAVETVDTQLSRLIPAVLANGGVTIITSDHGNAEQLVDARNDSIDTEHNSFPSPFIFIAPDITTRQLQPGVLGDIAPTMLRLLGIDAPLSMRGSDVLLT